MQVCVLMSSRLRKLMRLTPTGSARARPRVGPERHQYGNIELIQLNLIKIQNNTKQKMNLIKFN